MHAGMVSSRKNPEAKICGSSILGGSWVVSSRVISRVTILKTHIRGLVTTPEPVSSHSRI